MGSRKSSKKGNETEVKRTVRADRSAGQAAGGKPVRSSSDNARWIIGVLVLLAGVFALIATVAYPFCYEHDYIAIHAPETDNPRFDDSVSNPCGPLGARLAEYFVCHSFGIAGLLVPVIFIMLGIRIIVKRARLLNHSVLTLLLITILGSLTLGLMFKDNWGMFGSGWGGAFGIAVSQMLYGYIGSIGAWIAVVLGWILTGVFINSNFINTVNRAGKVVVKQGGALVDNVVDTAGTLIHRPKSEQEETESDVERRDLTDETVAVPAEPTGTADIPQEDDAAEEPAREIEPEKPAADETADDAADSPEETSETEGAAERAGVKTIVVEEHSEAQMDERQMKNRPFNPDRTVGYKYPPVDFLIDYVSDSNVSDDEIIFNKRQIEDTLGNFGIPIREMKATIGPTVTLYEIVQEAGVKISRIQGLENDIAQSLKALGIRIIAPIPGRGTIGIEVPNRHKEVVSMRSAVQSERFHKFNGELPVVIG
ncbi:MAG: DNA translocase FtsK 4TM domain-containing protein, partial [Alistipes sp.]|nr:DNA translocase FtsK 4TM domain-containing protein [Alistipes sp.]